MQDIHLRQFIRFQPPAYGKESSEWVSPLRLDALALQKKCLRRTRARQYLSRMPRDWFTWASKVDNRTLSEIDFNQLDKTNCRDKRLLLVSIFNFF